MTTNSDAPTCEQGPRPRRSRATSCPVCGAPFRGTSPCPRCATDLAPLMRLMIRAWSLRNEASRRLARRELAGAHDAANASIALHATRHGRRLACVIGLLVRAARSELGWRDSWTPR